MLIEAAHRNQAAAREMLTQVGAGGASCGELREMLRVSEATISVIKAAQSGAASLIAKLERHGDGGTGVLAEVAGLSRRDARGQVKTAEAIAEAPTVRDAVEQGRVSQANARRLAEAVKKTGAEAVESDPGLLAKAESLRPEQFAKEARRWAADHQDDGGEREYRRLRAKRSVHVWDGEDGTVQLHGVFDPVTGTRISNRLRAEARRMYETDKKHATGSNRDNNRGAKPGGRGNGHGRRISSEDGSERHGNPDAGESSNLPDAERRTFAQCMADALDNFTSHTFTPDRAPQVTSTGRVKRTIADTAKGASAGRGGSTGAVSDIGAGASTGSASASDSGAGRELAQRLILEAASGADRCTGAGRSFADISVIAHVNSATGKLIAELPDGARLPEAMLDELVCNARLTGLVYDTTGTPIWRAKSSRTATEQQRQVLLNQWGGCFHCAAHPDMCQIHHIVPVSQGGATKIDNMVPVCWDCHNKIHHQHWQIRKRSGGQHTLHPPDSTHYGPAHAPEQPLLFRATDGDDPRAVRRPQPCSKSHLESHQL